MGHHPTPPTFFDLATFIAQCARVHCVPILQMNAAVALLYGADECARLTSRMRVTPATTRAEG